MWANAGQFIRHQSSDSSGSSDEPASSESCTESDWMEHRYSLEEAEDDSERDDPVTSTLSITRRTHTYGTMQAPDPPANCRTHNWDNIRDISAIQTLDADHTKQLAATFPAGLWRVLGSVLDQSKTTQSKVLRAVSTLLSARDRKIWPTTREMVDTKLSKFGSISSRLTRTASVDLSHIDLAALHEPIAFKFLDKYLKFCARCTKLAISGFS